MPDIHNMFHLSLMRNWVSDVDKRVPKSKAVVHPNLTYIEEPKCILLFARK